MNRAIASISILSLILNTGCALSQSDRDVFWTGVRAESMGVQGFDIVSIQPNMAGDFIIVMPDDTRIRAEDLRRGWAGDTFIDFPNGFVTIQKQDDDVTHVILVVKRGSGVGAATTPSLGDAAGRKIYPLPITYKQLVELFGSPCEIREYSRPL